MSRTPLPRWRVDISLPIELGAATEAEAAARLDAIREFIEARLTRATFTRLPGQPVVPHSGTTGDISAT